MTSSTTAPQLSADIAGPIVHRLLDTPVGRLVLAATDRGVIRIGFPVEGADAVLADLERRTSARLVADGGQLDDAARELDEYFAGTRTVFDLPLDHRLSSGFRLTVQQYLPTIGYGRTQTYGEVADAVGNPGASRAVGTACSTNPLPIVVPCHRVLRSDGSLGGYAGGLDVKRALLDLEKDSAERLV